MSKKGNGVELSSFKYVDARFGNSAWTRIELEKLPEFVEKHKRHDVYCTVQRYAIKTRKQGADEPMHAPLFFDFDSKRNLLQLIDQGWLVLGDVEPLVPDEVFELLQKRELGQPLNDDDLEIELGIKPYKIDNPDDKEKRVEHFHYLSEDLKMLVWKKNLEAARQDVEKLLDFFLGFGLTEDEVRVWFSGQKGFHVIVHETVVGTSSGIDLHKRVKHIALYLQELLGLKSLDSGSIYAKGRMWRIPDTVHPSTGKYKTELRHEEVRAGDIGAILNLASTPRGPLWKPEEVEYALNADMNKWYLEHMKAYEENERTINVQVSDTTLQALTDMEGYPTCVRYIMDHGDELMRQTGANRNMVTYRLATYFKDAGYTLQDAYETILEWALALPRDVSSSSASEKRANTMSAVKTIYETENYHFSCGGMRSIGKRSANDKTIVPCSGRGCAVHDDHGIDEVEATKAHLADTSRAEFVGQKVAFDCLVSGKLDTPYQVPKKVEFYCRAMDPEKSVCQTCVLLENGGSFEREFHENDRFLIEAVGQPDNNLKGILRAHSGASCNKVSCRTIDWVNVSEVLVVPMAERVTSIKVNDDDTITPLEKAVDGTGKEYVSRKVYAIGNDLKTNNHYEFTGYVYPHPKTQLATVLSQTQQAKQDTVGDFKLTEEMKEQFKVFQVQEGETLDDRLDLLIQDIVGNVTLVRQRDAIHLAVLLTYHSVLRYYFMPGELEARGWMELCMVGDSGQAKSQLLSRLQEFCGLGELIGGETAGRTGLLYSLQQMGDRWFITFGKYPLNDRKLLAIDEFSGLSEGDFEQMTESRETGVLRVTRVINTETNARTRLIFMSNPRHGKQLAEFSYGVESLKQLFREAADIRRLDLAVFLKSGDVPQKIMNQEYPAPSMQLIKPDVMKASVLWAWSRNENQIVIDSKTRDVIFKAANDLGDKYGAAVDIPLLEPATLRKKLARMSIALAALLHSTDENHEKIIVKPEHVKCIRIYLDTMYSYKNCRLDIYAQKARNESVLGEDEADNILQAFSTGDFAENAYATRDILDLFRKNDVLKAQEIADLTGLEKPTINARLNLLQKHLLIKRSRDGMRKTPKGIEFIEIYFNEE